jgi:hypothetical protein
MKHQTWIRLSGLIWLFAGCSLMYKGLAFLAEAAFDSHSLCSKMQNTFGTSQKAATALMALGLMIGFLKGRFVLSKTVQRMVFRIQELPLPIRFKLVYPRSYWLLIGCMMGLGILLKYLPIPVDIRGTIDIAIGSALINGALLYFKAARSMYFLPN